MQFENFRTIYTHQYRKDEAQQMIDAHPTCAPVIMQSKTQEIVKSKYIVPQDMQVPQYMSYVRKKLGSLKPSDGIFFFVRTSKRTRKRSGRP